MRRQTIRAAAIFACALATTGCASTSADNVAAQNGSSVSNQTASQTADAKPSNTQQSKTMPSNLDGEIHRAELLRAQGDYKAAIHSLSQLMLIAPDNPRIVSEYGKALAQDGRAADALAFLGRAIELQPNDWTLYSASGVAYDQLAQHDKAETAYKHALSLKPGNPVVLNNYAMSQAMAGHLDRADALLHQADLQGGDHPKIVNNLKMIAQMKAERGVQPDAAQNVAKPAPATGLANNSAPKTTTPHATATAKATAAPEKPLSEAKAAPTGAPHKLQPAIAQESKPDNPLARKAEDKHAPVPAKAAPEAPLRDVAKADEPRQAKSKPQNVAAENAAPALRTAADIY